MERQTLAYLLMLLMAAAIAYYVGYRRHHGRDRTYRRRQSREAEAYEKSMSDKEKGGRS
jgi:hypothetical protein